MSKSNSLLNHNHHMDVAVIDRLADDLWCEIVSRCGARERELLSIALPELQEIVAMAPPTEPIVVEKTRPVDLIVEGCGFIETQIEGVKGDHLSLCTSCKNGRLDRVKELIELNESLDLSIGHNLPLVLACENGHLEIVRFLLSLEEDACVDPNVQRGLPLRQACQNGHLSVVRELLKVEGDRKIDPSAFGNIAMIVACANGHLNIVRELVSLEADLVSTKSREYMAFRLACEGGHLPVVRELLHLNGTAQVRAKNDGALHGASKFGHIHVVKLLKTLGSQCGSQTSQAFRYACKQGYLNVARFLLSLTGPMDESDPNANLDSAYRKSSANGHVAILRLLLSLEGDHLVNTRVLQNSTVEKAIRCGHTTVVKELLSLTDSRSVCHWDAARLPNPLVIVPNATTLRAILSLVPNPMDEEEALIAACAQRPAQFHYQHHPPNKAEEIQEGYAAVVRELIGRRESVHPRLAAACLETATDCDRSQIVVALLSESKVVLEPSVVQEVFERACNEMKFAVAQVLLGIGDDRQVDPTVENNLAIRQACASGHLPFVRALLTLRGARCVDPSDQENAAVRNAFANGHYDVVRELLHSDHPNSVDPTAIPLRMASAVGDLEIVREILAKAGHNGNAASGRMLNIYSSAVDNACREGHSDILKVLMESGAQCRLVDNLTTACVGGHYEVVKTLLPYCKLRDSLLPHTRYLEALTTAASKGYLDIVRLLLANGVGPDLVEKSLWQNPPRPLDEACRSGHLRVVRELLQAGADTSDDSSALVAAASGGHIAVVRALLAIKGKRAVSPGARGNQAIKSACRGKHMDVVVLLASTVGRGVNSDLPMVQDITSEYYMGEILE